MSVAIIIITFIVALFLAIFLHELGHFIVAKRAGVKVEEFGIGLPPRLFGIRRGETIYSVNAIPIGAFVKAAGEDDPTVPRSLAGRAPSTRLGIYVAGPLMNILLAFVLLSAFFALPVSFVAGNGVMVHSVEGNSPAEEAGIQPGDVILELAGQPVRRWRDVQNIVNLVEEGAEMPLLLQRNGQNITKTVTPKFDPELQRRVIGVLLCWNMVRQVDEGSPAYMAGIRPGDTILTINGQAVFNDESMSTVIRSIPEGEAINVTLLRGRNATVATLINVAYETLPGAELRWVDGIGIEQEWPPVWRAIYLGARFIIHTPLLIIESIPLMIRTPDLALVGPIGAGQLTVEVVRTLGFSRILFMAGIISMGIAIFNLLPIPPLDGGGMLVAFIEGCRRGKRLSPRTLRLVYTIGTSLLIALVILVTFVDIWRLPRGFGP